MTDTPVQAPTTPPPTPMEQFKGFIGDLARPFALISTACACAAGVLVSGVGADKLTIGFGALTLMYGAKALEVQQTSKQDAQVKIAQATATK